MLLLLFFFTKRMRHTGYTLVSGVLTYALPISHRLEHHRMCDSSPGLLLHEDDLSLLVELRPLVVVADGLCLLDQILEGLVAPLGAVGAAHGVTAEQHGQEVVRVAVVAGPADRKSVV